MQGPQDYGFEGGLRAGQADTSPRNLIRSIRQDLATLAHLTADRAGAEFAEISAALARIEDALAQAARPAGTPLDDPAMLERLLTLAGPRDGAELLRRLDEDLGSIAVRLDPGGHQTDVAGLRAATHVLISLAGSVGARSIEERARKLNQSVHDGLPRQNLDAECASLLREIGLLRDELSRRGSRQAGVAAPPS